MSSSLLLSCLLGLSRHNIELPHHYLTIAMSHGNWKDLFKAAGEGNLQLIRGHLKNGVDPNYQHPEYFTSPMFEAIRAGQREALEILLDHGGSPTLPEESTEKTPIEVAMSEGHHDMVDLLMTRLEEKDIRPYCKRIEIYGENVPAHTAKSIYATLLEQGHQAVIVPECYDRNKVDVHALAQELRATTKNKKVEVVSRRTKPSISVDTIIFFGSDRDFIKQNLKDVTTTKDSEASSSCRVVMLCTTAPSDALRDALMANPLNTAAMRVHDSWLDRMTKYFWEEKWLDSVAWIATEKDGALVCGKIHSYDAHHRYLQSIPFF